MTPKERAAMRLALEALEFCKKWASRIGFDAAITALREALAEQVEQEPCIECGRPTMSAENKCDDCHSMDDAAPVQQVDLTDDEIESYISEHRMADYIYRSQAMKMCRAVIAADREKNR